MGYDVVCLLVQAFRFRIYPTEEQIATMRAWEASLRWLWNLANEQRMMGLRRTDRVFTNYYTQNREMTDLVKLDDRLRSVPSCVRQAVLSDLDKAWQRWSKRLGGLPHFKRHHVAMRLYAPDKGAWTLSGGGRGAKLRFRGLDEIRCVADRELIGRPTSCTIIREVDQYFAIILCDVPPMVTCQRPGVLAINRGAICGYARDDGKTVDAPQSLEQSLRHLARQQRKLRRMKSGSRNMAKQRDRIAKLHRTIRRQREHWQHVNTADLSRAAGTIVVEEWRVQEMTSKKPDPDVKMPKHMLNRKILDVGWYAIEQQLRYKTEREGGKIAQIDPAFISQTCTKCGSISEEKPDKKRIVVCASCGYEEHVDVRAATNLRRRFEVTPEEPPKASKPKKKIFGPVRRPKTTGKSPVAASGGYLDNQADEGGTRAREGGGT